MSVGDDTSLSGGRDFNSMGNSMGRLTSGDLRTGYENEFRPVLDNKFECPICLQALREPCQTGCGHKYCQNCILKWLRDEERGKKCPSCNVVLSENQLFLDKATKREVLAHNVHCLYAKNGCSFQTALNHVEEHEQLCEFSSVGCPNGCGTVMLKKDSEIHMRDTCPSRSEMCPHCRETKAAADMEAHKENCPLSEVQCRHCSETLFRQHMNRHLSQDCPKIVIKCSFNRFGCNERVAREDLATHFDSSTQPHLRMLGAKVLTLMMGCSSANPDPDHELYSSFSAGDLPDDIALSVGSLELTDAASDLLTLEGDSAADPPSTLRIENLEYTEQRPTVSGGRSDSGPDQSSSSPTGRVGAMSRKLSVIAQEERERLGTATGAAGVHHSSTEVLKSTGVTGGGSAKGNGPNYYHRLNSSQFSSYAGGDWPEDGPLSALSTAGGGPNEPPSSHPWAASLARGENSSYAHSLAAAADSAVRETYRVKELEREVITLKQCMLALQAKVGAAETARMNAQTALSELEGRCCGGVFVWKLHDFARRRQEALQGCGTSVLHSDGFYTGFHGYKMCVRLNLNGVDSAQGTHLSLFIHLLQGEYDDILQWPFSGTITLSILDQTRHGRRSHITETLAAKPSLAAFQRPTSLRNHKGFGYMEFAPLSYLQRQSRGYIYDDTLIIRAEVKPAPGQD